MHLLFDIRIVFRDHLAVCISDFLCQVSLCGASPLGVLGEARSRSPTYVGLYVWDAYVCFCVSNIFIHMYMCMFVLL